MTRPETTLGWEPLPPLASPCPCLSLSLTSQSCPFWLPLHTVVSSSAARPSPHLSVSSTAQLVVTECLPCSSTCCSSCTRRATRSFAGHTDSCAGHICRAGPMHRNSMVPWEVVEAPAARVPFALDVLGEEGLRRCAIARFSWNHNNLALAPLRRYVCQNVIISAEMVT